MPLVGLVMGSKSDMAMADKVVAVLQEMGIDHEVKVLSAHRTPEATMNYAVTARDRGLEILIAMAGGSAALPGFLAAWTTLPVIGVPLPSSEIGGIDSLLSIAQMPPGIPVACVAVGAWGAQNAAYLAAEILGLRYTDIRDAYEEHRRKRKTS